MTDNSTRHLLRAFVLAVCGLAVAVGIVGKALFDVVAPAATS